MRRKWKVLTLAAMLATLAGCKGSATGKPKGSGNDIPPNSCRVTVEDLVDQGNLFVKHITLTAHGERWVRVTEEASVHEAKIEPDHKTALMSADVVLVANLFSSTESSKSQLTWLVQIKGRGVTVGGPLRIEVPFGKKLSEVVSVDIAPGDHPVGQDIPLGTVLDRTLILKVE
jgi:hypothetical protein